MPFSWPGASCRVVLRAPARVVPTPPRPAIAARAVTLVHYCTSLSTISLTNEMIRSWLLCTSHASEWAGHQCHDTHAQFSDVYRVSTLGSSKRIIAQLRWSPFHASGSRRKKCQRHGSRDTNRPAPVMPSPLRSNVSPVRESVSRQVLPCRSSQGSRVSA